MTHVELFLNHQKGVNTMKNSSIDPLVGAAPSPFKVLSFALSKVPGLKILFGVVAVAAILAIVRLWALYEVAAIIGGGVVVVFAVVLLLLARLSQASSRTFHIPILMMLWFCVLLFMVWCMLLSTCVFFQWPVRINELSSGPGRELKASSESLQSPTQSGVEVELFAPNYMRLFGAIEVPLLMEMFEKRPNFIKLPQLSSEGIPSLGIKGQSYYKLTEESTYIISSDLRHFWEEQWRYKNARPLRNRLWEHFCGSQDAGINAFYNALEPVPDDMISFSMHTQIDEDGQRAAELASKLNVDWKEGWYDNPPGTTSDKVAFLFLILENASDHLVTDINIYCREFENPIKTRKYSNLDDLSEGGWLSPSGTALTDVKILNLEGKSSVLRVASMAPREAYIWLLAVYKADSNGLPLFYITNVQIPDSISAVISGAKKEQSIRRPYLLHAARIAVPNGWFGQ